MNSLISKVLFISLLVIGARASLASSNYLTNLHEKKERGYLVFAIPIKLGAFTPLEPNNAHTQYTLPLIFEPLVTIDSHQKLLPVLAKSWVVSPDNKSIIITLNERHYFSDSTEVTANDIVDSFTRLCASQSHTKPTGLKGCGTIHNTSDKPVTAIDKYNVKFNISCSPTNFLYQLAHHGAVITKSIDHRLIGSGPYQLEAQFKDQVILGKNMHYTGKTPPVNSGIILIYADKNMVAQELAQKEIDGALIYRAPDLPPMTSAGFKFIVSNSNISEIFVMNNQRYPFNKSIVRKALASAIYNEFDTTCLSGTRHAYGIIPDGIGGSINGVAPKYLTEYTPSDVFNHVPELKKNRVTVTIHQLEDLQIPCEMRQLQKIANKYNINFVFKHQKEYSSFQPLMRSVKTDGFIELYVYIGLDANPVLRHFTLMPDNHAHVSNNLTDDLLSKAIMAETSHMRYQGYNKLTSYLQDEAIVIPLFYMSHGSMISTCLSGVPEDFYVNSFNSLPMMSKKPSCSN